MNASRLLFEGLEDRILLSGIPAALIASLPRVTETHSGGVTGVLAGVDGPPFFLPKFDDHGGTRMLVQATLTSATTITDGTRQVENQSMFAGQVNTLILTLGAESDVFVVRPFPTGVPRPDTSVPFNQAPTFTFGPIDVSASLPAPTTDNIGPSATLDWVPNHLPGELDDMVSVTLAGQGSGTQQETVSYPSAQLNDFISSPGDSTIMFVATSQSSVTLVTTGIVARTRTFPLIKYDMVGQVIYQYITLTTDEDYYAGSKHEFKKLPAAVFQPFYSGTAQPGATLAVDVLGLGGEVLGSTSTIVDAGGNWGASFHDLGMTGEPHTVSIRQSYAGYTPLTGAGYNLRRYFSPAILGGAYASEHLTVENVLGNRAADVSMAALYSASANPIALGPTLYAYETLPMPASPQGLH